MAQLIVVYWRDIPAQVIVKSGRQSAKRQLDVRFEKAIDRVAMRAKLRDTDSYLGDWRRAEPAPCGDDLEAEADAAETLIGQPGSELAPLRRISRIGSCADGDRTSEAGGDEM